jgi:alpha-tubulin suppressor-like RCC1 family protein
VNDVTVRDVVCGAAHSAVLLSNGAIFSFGLNSNGQTGQEGRRTPTPRLLLSLTDVKARAIAAGDNATAVIV